MPHPYWGWFAIAMALIGVIEWEELSLGYLRRGLYEHMMFFATPVIYAVAAWWLFVGSPLSYAAQIRTFAADACESHHGLNPASVDVVYDGGRSRRYPLSQPPAVDRITLLCNDGAGVSAIYSNGHVTAVGARP